MGFCGSNVRPISQEVLMISISKMSLKNNSTSLRGQWVSILHFYVCQLTWITNPRMHLFHISECSIQNRNVHAPVPYPRMLHSEQKCAHFCSEWRILGYGTGAFWDLWNWFIIWVTVLFLYWSMAGQSWAPPICVVILIGPVSSSLAYVWEKVLLLCK